MDMTTVTATAMVLTKQNNIHEKTASGRFIRRRFRYSSRNSSWLSIMETLFVLSPSSIQPRKDMKVW